MARNRARLCLVGLLLCALLGLACAGCAPALPERTGSGQAPVASDTGAAQALEETAAASVLPEGPDFTGWRDGAPFICYGERDALGRATAACALLGRELLTDRDRPDMSQLAPTGLQNAAYDFVRDRWVYNRCHLIGHQFSGESTPDNLVTGTRALNHTYMLPWENRVADYLRRTGEHVFYRVTPRYEGDELVCRSVLVEAMSCDRRRSLCFAVACPNVQPGVAIDYLTGYTTLADDWRSGGTVAGPRRYTVNTRSGRFHLPECEDAGKIAKRRRSERTCGRGELLREGLKPCGKCRP